MNLFIGVFGLVLLVSFLIGAVIGYHENGIGKAFNTSIDWVFCSVAVYTLIATSIWMIMVGFGYY